MCPTMYWLLETNHADCCVYKTRAYSPSVSRGTCNSSNWRESLIKLLNVPYYNPVVPDWTPDCIDEELRQRATCRLCLYVITPAMSGVYSIAELVEDSIKSPNRTIACFLREDGEYMFGDKQWKSIEQVSALVSRNGARVFASL